MGDGLRPVLDESRPPTVAELRQLAGAVRDAYRDDPPGALVQRPESAALYRAELALLLGGYEQADAFLERLRRPRRRRWRWRRA